MRTRRPFVVATAAAGIAAVALVAGPAWANLSADPEPVPGHDQMMSDEDMEGVHEQMLRDYPGMGRMHERMPQAQMPVEDCPMHQ